MPIDRREQLRRRRQRAKHRSALLSFVERRENLGHLIAALALVAAIASAVVAQSQTRLLARQTNADAAAKTRERLVAIGQLLDKLQPASAQLVVLYGVQDCDGPCAQAVINLSTIRRRDLPPAVRGTLDALYWKLDALKLPADTAPGPTAARERQSFERLRNEYLKPTQLECLTQRADIDDLLRWTQLLFSLRRALGPVQAQGLSSEDPFFELRIVSNRERWAPGASSEEDIQLSYQLGEFQHDVSVLTRRHLELWRKVVEACREREHHLTEQLRQAEAAAQN